MRGSGGLGTGVGLEGGVRVGVTHEEGPRVQGEGGESGEGMGDGGLGWVFHGVPRGGPGPISIDVGGVLLCGRSLW